MSELIYNKGDKNTQCGTDSLSDKRWENWTAICKGMKLEHFLILHTKIN